MKKLLFTLILSLLLCSLSGCNKKIKPVSNKQLKKDIQEFLNENPDDPIFNDIKVTLDKRQTNLSEKNELIYCNVSGSTSISNMTGKVILDYTFFDVGGWCPNDIKIEEDSVTWTPSTGVEIDKIATQYQISDKTFELIKQSTDLENLIDTLEYSLYEHSPFITTKTIYKTNYFYNVSNGIWNETDSIETDIKQIPSDINGFYDNTANKNGKDISDLTINYINENEISLDINTPFGLKTLIMQKKDITGNLIEYESDYYRFAIKSPYEAYFLNLSNSNRVEFIALDNSIQIKHN